MKLTFTAALLLCVISNVWGQYDEPDCPTSEKLWNTYSQWKWMAQDQPIYHTEWEYYYSPTQTAGTLARHKMPFFSEDPILTGLAFDPTLPNLTDLPIDYKPAEGWELVRRGIGDATTGTNFPYWVFYNRFSAKLRIFALSFVTRASTYKEMRLYFGSPYNPNLLTSSSSPILPIDQIRLYNSSISNSVFTAHMEPSGNGGNWYYADFPMSYDPCTCFFQSADLQVDIKEITVENINFTLDPINPIGHSDANGAISFQNTIQSANEKIESSVKSLKNLNGSVDDLLKGLDDIGDFNLKKRYHDEFDGLANKLSAFEIIPEIGPVISGVIGLSDMFSNVFSTGSDSKSSGPAPIMIMNSFKASGTITVQTQGEGFHFNVPGGMQTGSGFHVNYNSPLGNFALLKTPVIEAKRGFIINEEINTAIGYNLDAIPTDDHVVAYEDFLFKISEPIQWVINPSAGFDLSKSRIEARLEIDLPNAWHSGPPLSATEQTNEFGTFDLINQGPTNITVGGKFLPLGCFQNSTARLRLSKRYIPIPQLPLGSLKIVDWRKHDGEAVDFSTIRQFSNTDNPQMFVKIAARLVHPSGNIHNFVARYPIKYNFQGPRNPSDFYLSYFLINYPYINANIAPYYASAITSIADNPGNTFGIQELPLSRTLEAIPIAISNANYSAIESINIKSNLVASPGITVNVYAGHDIVLEDGFEIGPGVSLIIQNMADGCVSTSANPITDLASFCTSTINPLYRVAGRNASRSGDTEDSQDNLSADIINISPNPALLNSTLKVFVSKVSKINPIINFSDPLGRTIPITVTGSEGSYQIRHQATAPGVYTLTVTTSQGVQRKRVVLQ